MELFEDVFKEDKERVEAECMYLEAIEKCGPINICKLPLDIIKNITKILIGNNNK